MMMWFQETALSEVSSTGEKERVGWFEAVSADDVEAVKEMLKESPASVNMVDEVSSHVVSQFSTTSINQSVRFYFATTLHST